MKETILYLDNLLKNDDVVVIGLSGGPDSMCLTHLLLTIKKNIKIVCAHINHNIRDESCDEASFVEEFCQKNDIIFETTTFTKKSDISDYSESELREKRYKYFDDIIKKYNAKYLLTAHHGDDLIETILMRISRGSNLKGYAGFSLETKKANYKIVRPLIFTTKKDIEEYNNMNGIPSIIDKTNVSDKYTRNRYRHKILPFLKKENSNVHQKYLKYSQELLKYYNFVDETVEKELDKRYQDETLDIKNYASLDNLIKTKIIERILSLKYGNNIYLINNRHVELILGIIESKKPNIEINLPNNIHLLKSYNKLKIKEESSNNTVEYRLKLTDSVNLPNGHSVEILNNCEKTDNNCLRLNSNEIKLPLYIRTRKNGDKMIVKNMVNSKKIKEIFIDCKIEKEKRDTFPILVDANDTILWLPGLKKSKFDKAKSDLYDIILWYN